MLEFDKIYPDENFIELDSMQKLICDAVSGKSREPPHAKVDARYLIRKMESVAESCATRWF